MSFNQVLEPEGMLVLLVSGGGFITEFLLADKRFECPPVTWDANSMGLRKRRLD